MTQYDAPPPGWYPPPIPPTPPSPPSGWYPPAPAPGPSTLYLPNLIVAMVASVGIVIGSLGPWLTFLVFNRTAADGDGAITLVLGIVALVVLFAIFNLGRNRKKTGIAALGCVAALAGLGAFVVGVVDAVEVTSRRVELFGRTVGAQIGWGLWLVLISSLVLTVTAIIVVKQVPHGGDPALARWLRDREQADLARWDREGEQKGWRLMSTLEKSLALATISPTGCREGRSEKP
jgi:hypothetical protein